mmetsp:Transcript_86627/g.269210  ORF Transcript_86627/g.269210 Transcript_86627/m.269210 type:complete len:146 (+) Transcript_86627:2-439(+)
MTSWYGKSADCPARSASKALAGRAVCGGQESPAMRAERTLLPTVVELRSGAKHTAGARGPWGQPVAACQLPSLHRVTFGNAAISSEAAGGVRPARPHGLLPAIKHAHGNSNDSLVGDAGLCCTLQSAELTMLARPDVRKVLDRLG